MILFRLHIIYSPLFDVRSYMFFEDCVMLGLSLCSISDLSYYFYKDINTIANFYKK